ncbi:hypothetical protein AVEN_173321-1 [Araneus ventricosus]|uniref:Uncharacterized protein n=1 Tax=Araneus ventricosus TaxID=182803 RepID=A0A4Y2V105_ARAVE|nr:hypothetical protein AVEN_173321-1 [Araneus ventricosus]
MRSSWRRKAVQRVQAGKELNIFEWKSNQNKRNPRRSDAVEEESEESTSILEWKPPRCEATKAESEQELRKLE